MKAKLPTTGLILIAMLLAGPSATAAIQSGQMMQGPPAGQKAPQKRRSRGSRSTAVPKGVQACIDRLIEIASADPLPAYGGQAEKIVNDGLLWNDPKSKCSVGDDQALRTKISNMVVEWRQKNADKVRSLLQEIKSAAPQT
jgi:hypothetical protein